MFQEGRQCNVVNQIREKLLETRFDETMTVRDRRCRERQRKPQTRLRSGSSNPSSPVMTGLPRPNRLCVRASAAAS
eukprot:1185134-Pleurochrysis_carterae.AAC.1